MDGEQRTEGGWSGWSCYALGSVVVGCRSRGWRLKDQSKTKSSENLKFSFYCFCFETSGVGKLHYAPQLFLIRPSFLATISYSREQ